MPAFALALGYLATLLGPLALAAWRGPAPRSPADELASGAGMMALSIILVEFALSGRFAVISRRTGLDATMRMHQLFARTALALALVHPFLYRAPAAPPPPWDPTRQGVIAHEPWALAGGIAAWLILPALSLSAIGRDALGWRHETWRLTHGALALAALGGALHHALSAGRYAAEPTLAAVWIAGSALAALSLLWARIGRPLALARRPWRIAALAPAAEGVWRLRLEPDGWRGFRYTAGQFAWLKLACGPFSIREHPFSIASAPASGDGLEFLIKELGDFTSRIGALEVGARAWVDGPHGALTIEGRPAPRVALIAGGVGIAPLLGIARQMALTNDPRPLTLVYGNRRAEQIVHADELEALAARPRTRVALALAEPPPGWRGHRGVIDPGLIRALFGAPEHRDTLFLLCGPPAMMESVEGALIALGVPARRILFERFRHD
ncbi:ferredoxin reductase family protein [Oceanicella actignis]|uniref:Predicted ferric reductase n=1 Tax=Oceanicella actignis TaxID=1189325 RepID=A0A1M7TFI3_9RHOB|nr:ferredoxin reductase family protein [Oceanicella actignis]SET61053.1 Predicted ferric reductase [Oceanicella actignis]SHN69475.1 Predicted ferric reductase [Oceanicella actignis]